MSLGGSSGGEVGEVFAFSDTLTVVPGNPVKDLCMSFVSVPVWRGME